MKTLDIEAVQAFVLVADLASFTRAAEAMASTQSAVSLRLKRLEDELGRRLFERTPRRVRLTAAGQLFLERARSLVAAHASALEAFAQERRRLAIGITDHAAGAELPQLLQRVKRAEPGLVLEMRVGSSRDLIAALDEGELDAAIVLADEAGRRAARCCAPSRLAGWRRGISFTVRESHCRWPRSRMSVACAPWESPRWIRRALPGRRYLSAGVSVPLRPQPRRGLPSPYSAGGWRRRTRPISDRRSACLHCRRAISLSMPACPIRQRGNRSERSAQPFAQWVNIR